MSTVSKPTKRPSPEADPFRYGWRYVKVKRPGGTEEFDQVPLTLEDVLHPEEGDFIVQSQAHINDWVYLNQVFKVRLADDPSAAVVSACRVAWDVPGLKAHGPDVAVIFGVRDRHNWATFDVAREGTRPALVVEVVLPEYDEVRENDVTIKVEHYHRAGVAYYVIVDDLGRGDERRLELIGYRWEPAGYRRMGLDERGSLWLEPVRLWLGVAGDPVARNRVACYDPATGQEIGDYAAEVEARAEAEARARAAEARAGLEGRLRQVEEEVRRLRGGS